VTDTWRLSASDGELLVHTGVVGPASKMGHRLTIAMRRWEATVRWADDAPASAQLKVDVDSLEVLQGEGGLTSLSGPEKTLVRSNALRQLGAERFPEIRFDTDSIDPIEDGYRLSGALQIRGKTRPHVIDLRTEDLGAAWCLSTESVVRQSDFGVKPYSMLMGALKVADEVTVVLTAKHEKE
jgi:polyisoprenoid-binding protein YceI